MLHKNKVRRYRPITIFKAEGFLHNIPTEFGIFQGGFFGKEINIFSGIFKKNTLLIGQTLEICNVQCSPLAGDDGGFSFLSAHIFRRNTRAIISYLPPSSFCTCKNMAKIQFQSCRMMQNYWDWWVVQQYWVMQATQDGSVNCKIFEDTFKLNLKNVSLTF